MAYLVARRRNGRRQFLSFEPGSPQWGLKKMAVEFYKLEHAETFATGDSFVVDLGETFFGL